jgi:hypothetical protein
MPAPSRPGFFGFKLRVDPRRRIVRTVHDGCNRRHFQGRWVSLSLCCTGYGRATNLASRRRFWAMEARTNSSWAPRWPRRVGTKNPGACMGRRGKFTVRGGRSKVCRELDLGPHPARRKSVQIPRRIGYPAHVRSMKKARREGNPAGPQAVSPKINGPY